MLIGSLFSGIGGIDLAFQWAGFEIAYQVEIDPFCRAVLSKHWPGVPKHKDVHDVGKRNLATVDVMAGGFPCQPVSVAGRRKAQEDSRWLWPEFARLIGDLRPRVVFLENVPGITTAGGNDVVTALACMGYDAEWAIVPASAVGAPHPRKRWYCVAYTHGERRVIPAGSERHCSPDAEGRCVGNSDSEGLSRPRLGIGTGASHERAGATINGTGRGVAESILGRAIDGLSRRLDGHRWPARPGEPQYDWEAPRTVKKGQVRHRADRVRALGNAVVPQVIYPLAVAIREWLQDDDKGE